MRGRGPVEGSGTYLCFYFSCVRHDRIGQMYRALWMLTALGCITCICGATEPKLPEIVSPLTLVAEENLIENPKAIPKGKVESILWQRFRIQRRPSGEDKEVPSRSRLSNYDADVHVIEMTDREINQARSANT